MWQIRLSTLGEKEKEGDSMFWPFFFYMTLTHYFTSMNLLRQCCAMAFTLNIFTVLRRDDSFKGYVKAIILILIGTMFHSSAVVCAGFLLPFLIRRSGRWSIIGILLGSVAAILFFPTILDQLYVLFPKYMHYEESRYFAEAGLGPYYIMQIVLKFFMLLMICLLDPDDPENRDTYRLGFLVALSAGISMLVSKTVLAGRVNFYYDIFAILLIPRAVDHLTEGETRQRLYAILTVWGVLMMFYNMLGSSKGCVPYYFFWQSKP